MLNESRLLIQRLPTSSLQSGVAIVSFTNILTLDMALNWALHLRLAGVAPGPLVGLMEDVDEEGYARLAPHVMAFAAHSQSSTRHEMDAQGGRWALARAVMQVAVDAGVSLLISDNDVAWLRVSRAYQHQQRLSPQP